MGLFTKDIATMDDLLLHGLKDIYYAENQIVKSLPKLIDKATNRDLSKGLRDHLEAFRMAFLRCCHHQILGPRRHLPKLSNGLCRNAGPCVGFNAHFGWQAAESYVERSNIFALISGHRVLTDLSRGPRAA